MIKKIIFFSFSFTIICLAEIEIRKDQPKVSIKLFKSDDVKEDLETFPVSDDVKKDFSELVEYYSNEDAISNANIVIPKIIFLYGYHQNGDKWRLARVFAKELKYSMIRILPFELLEVNIPLNYILKKLDDAGPCVVFIDTFEELVKKTIFDSKFLFQINSVVNLIKELPIILICSVNEFPNFKIKEIITEPGITKEIVIPFPDLPSREKIIKFFVKDTKTQTDVDYKKLSMLTFGFTTSNLFEFVNEARHIALKDNRDSVSLNDFDLSLSKLKFGRIRNYKNDDRKNTAYHEAGHALVKLLLLNEMDPFYKITIVSRDAYIGSTSYYFEERHNLDKKYLFSRIKVHLAGTIAERLVFNMVSSGATQDLQKATRLATEMICKYGMSDTLVPMIYNKKDKIVKQEIQNIIKNAYDETYKLLADNKDKLDKIANLLMEKETIFESEIYQLLDISVKN